MDPQGGAMMNDGGVYNFAEIWQGFHMNPAAAASFAAGVPLDPMPMDDRSNQSSPGSNRNYRKRRHEDELAKGGVSTSNSITNVAANGGDNREALSNENHQNLAGKEGDPGKAVDKPTKSAEPPKQDYIHVRARRGQATDSHSLAERARREKISERMKILQDLVPGCNKIIGKALVLDEIINYIQSLQRQVEFLSMKLETVNTRVGIDGYPSKDFTQQTFDASGMAFGSQSTREYGRSSSPEWLHMQIGGGFERTPMRKV